jgi:signal transduction histidine kinase
MDGDVLTVTVADDGIGMADGATRGVGLTSMRERADELGGGLVISSAAGGGTTVVARLPVVARQA